MMTKQHAPARGADEPELEQLNRRYLQNQMAGIDVRLRRAVRLWQLAGQDASDAFRGLYISDAQADALLDRPLASNWGQTALLDADEEALFEEALAQIEHENDLLRQDAVNHGGVLRLDALASAFALGKSELAVLLLCLAPELDVRYERLYGYLQDDVTRKHPTVNLMLDLLCPAGLERLDQVSVFAEDAPLFQHRLVQIVHEPGIAQAPVLARSLCLDETILHWMLGTYHPGQALRQRAGLSAPRESADDVLLAGLSLAGLLAKSSENPVFALYGPDALAQEATARVLAARLSLSLLVLDLSLFEQEERSELFDAVQMALRDAQLTGAALHIKGWDVLLENGVPPHALLAEVCHHPGTALLGSRVRWQTGGVERQRRIAWTHFPIPDHAQRGALWQHFLAPLDLRDVDVTALAGQFTLTSGQIRDAVAAAQDHAGEARAQLTQAQLFAAARQISAPRLEGLARPISPRYGWEDIILPDDQIALLKEIVDTVRGRPLVLDDWGIARKLAPSRGITMLFAGPPGTGKTMAAEVLARELGMDLYKIDLSSLVSKYIGETEKNLAQVFSEAENSNAILFFDEADALFGKRSEVRDAHDRYANIEISYLLQRMETYDGVTILATNLRANLDEAFARRLQFIVDFPFPDEVYRLRIWRALVPAGVPCGPDLDFSLLSREYRLAGGNIRNVLLSAAYLAAADGSAVRMDHMLHGMRRELQKMGRMVDE